MKKGAVNQFAIDTFWIISDGTQPVTYDKTGEDEESETQFSLAVAYYGRRDEFLEKFEKANQCIPDPERIKKISFDDVDISKIILPLRFLA
jgi:hypothetical protein